MADDVELEPQASNGNGKKYEVAYDEAEMADVGTSQAEFDNAPKWEQDRISKIAYQRKTERESRIRAEAQLESERSRTSTLEQRLAALEAQTSGLTQSQPKKGWDAFSDAQLEDYESRHLGWVQRAAADPNDEEARKEVAGLDVGRLTMVQRELRNRAARGPVEELKGQIAAQQQATTADAQRTRKLEIKYGDEVRDMNSPLMQRARTILVQLCQENGWTSDPNGAISTMAIEQASRELRSNRPGREVTGADIRRQAMEGQARRGASLASSVTALRAKGDWESKEKATDLTVDAFLDELGIPE